MRKALWGVLLLAFIISACWTIETPGLKSLFDKKFDGRDLKLVKALSTAEAYTRYYITYMSGDLKISGIMNIPKGKGPFPVVILNHGYIDTRYYTNGRGLKREQDYLARRGFAVLHTDYRNHDGSDRDPDNALKLNIGYTEDVINAVYAVKNSAIRSLDKNNIGMLGHSLGGGIALNIMAIKPGLVKAYVLFAPISIDYTDNFDRWIKRRPPAEEMKIPTKYGPPETRHRIIEVYGTPQTNPKFWEGLSVKNYLDRIGDPVMVHQGLADDSVPPQWAQKLVKEFKAHGKDITLYTYKGEPHEFINAWPLVMERSVKFFSAHL